ncbi:hypothetical protein O181_057766, partial [Austropuccinia psidii MF-1]|nr:hypothetical protein [Austropuccinia psidii MF-1]
MNTNDQNNDLQKIIPILTDKIYSEWKSRMIICLKQKKLYQYCIEQCIPGDGVTRTPALEAKIIDTNVEACGLITKFLDSRTFAALVTSEEITQNSYLLWSKVNDRFASSTFNSKARVWIGINVEDEILAFSILTKLPEEFHSLIEKVTLNAETQGNPDAILNVLHEACLKEEALAMDTTKALVLKKDNFMSKVFHYCSNGKHNPLVTTHGPEKCWQLHPELKPEKRRKEKEQKAKFTIARALFTHESKKFEPINNNCARHRSIKSYVQQQYSQKRNTNKKTSSHFEVYLDNNNKPSFVCPITSNILETHVKLSDFRCLNTQAKKEGDLWHKRLGHMNKNNMIKLVKTTEISSICDECVKDLCGPFQTPSIGGAKYFLIIVDQMSGFITTRFLKNKSDCFNHFRHFKLSVENTLATKTINIFSDGGGEFVNKLFKKHCADSGINHTISPPYTPQHNPFSERGNRSVLEKARCLLLQSKLPMKYWAEAVSMATFLCNLVPKHKNQKTPYKIWHNTKPPLHRLKPFGCKAWLKIPTNHIKNKLGSKAWDGIFLGHVVFDEENFPWLPSQQQLTKDIIKTFPISTQILEEEVQTIPNTEDGSSSDDSTSINNDNED